MHEACAFARSHTRSQAHTHTYKRISLAQIGTTHACMHALAHSLKCACTHTHGRTYSHNACTKARTQKLARMCAQARTQALTHARTRARKRTYSRRHVRMHLRFTNSCVDTLLHSTSSLRPSMHALAYHRLVVVLVNCSVV
eukprot:6184966-Pleurochrysis_carterae.AAC.5